MRSDALAEKIQQSHSFNLIRVQAGNYRSRECNLLPEEYWTKLKLIKEAVLESDQLIAKAAWCFETIGKTQDTFVSAYTHFIKGEYYKGWCKLEECENIIVLLDKHFTDTNNDYGIEHIRVHVKNFQDIFPYRLFFSPSLLVKTKCSVCDTPITPRGQCQHIVGEIYDGVMCVQVVSKVVNANHIAIVENPVQKSSVLFANGKDNYNYDSVRYVVNKLNSPWQPWSYKKSKVLVKYKNVGRNELCPCGSGMKFKKCCWGKKIENFHYELII